MGEQGFAGAAKVKRHCLLLTADHYCRAVISDLFDDYGYSIVCLPSLKEVVHYAASDRSDLVVIDDNLGDMTPYEAVNIVRAAMANGGPIKAILLSAAATRRTVETARKAGFDALVAKPIAPAPFIRTLRNLTQALAA
ncbi:MAG: response regulator [Alphaproteobacteria bacterium]